MRSLLRQLEQIRNSATYDDAVASINTQSVAEPAVSGTLEGDMNGLRSIILGLKGGTNWFDTTGDYVDPSNTAVNKDMNLANIKGKTLDAQTVLIAVEDANGATGYYTVASGSTGHLITTTTSYADAVDRTGLPIFSSVGNAYYDEGGADTVCRIDVINYDTDSEFTDGSGHIVYAKFHDAADHGGTGENTDAYVRFYANNITYDMGGSDPTKVLFVYPVRKVMDDVAEHEWMRTDFVSGWEGDYELIEDISNLWSYTGASNDDSTTAGDWTNIAANYVLQTDPASLQTAIDLLNTGIGDRDYLEDNYIVDGESISDSLDKLDQNLKDVEESVAAGVGEKYVESAAADINSGVPHILPASQIYTPCADAGREGKNMDVYVDGQLVACDTSGQNDRDYDEPDTTHVTFHFTVHQGQNITYVIKQ